MPVTSWRMQAVVIIARTNARMLNVVLFFLQTRDATRNNAVIPKNSHSTSSIISPNYFFTWGRPPPSAGGCASVGFFSLPDTMIIIKNLMFIVKKPVFSGEKSEKNA